MTTAIIAFCILSVLLILGKALRVHLPILQKLYLPSSVIGGLVGLAVVQLCGARLPSEERQRLMNSAGQSLRAIDTERR